MLAVTRGRGVALVALLQLTMRYAHIPGYEGIVRLTRLTIFQICFVSWLRI